MPHGAWSCPTNSQSRHRACKISMGTSGLAPKHPIHVTSTPACVIVCGTDPILCLADATLKVNEQHCSSVVLTDHSTAVWNHCCDFGFVTEDTSIHIVVTDMDDHGEDDLIGLACTSVPLSTTPPTPTLHHPTTPASTPPPHYPPLPRPGYIHTCTLAYMIFRILAYSIFCILRTCTLDRSQRTSGG